MPGEAANMSAAGLTSGSGSLPRNVSQVPARSRSTDECVGAMSTVLVYSDDDRIRERVRLAIGRRPDPELEPIDFLDAAEGAAVTHTVGQGGIDLCILDGEAKPSGGLGLARELRD